MGLYERLIGTESPKIAVHDFMAALGEYERGKVTPPQITAMFALSASEQTEAATLLSKIIDPPSTLSFGAFLTLTNVGSAYDTTTAAWGLGFAHLESAGVNAFEFRVATNRNNATGTISWQLWDETTSTEFARIDDAAGVGNKMLSVSQSIATQPAGLHVIRIRVKSTNAADDPIYLGASVTIRRVNLMTSVVLHEVLLLGETGDPPYDSVAAVKARLGV